MCVLQRKKVVKIVKDALERSKKAAADEAGLSELETHTEFELKMTDIYRQSVTRNDTNLTSTRSTAASFSRRNNNTSSLALGRAKKVKKGKSPSKSPGRSPEYWENKVTKEIAVDDSLDELKVDEWIRVA